MVERALEAGVPASWVTADEVYGGDPTLRRFLEDRGISSVVAVKGTEPLGTATRASATAAQLAASVPVEQWGPAAPATVPRAAGRMTGPGSSWLCRLGPGWLGGCWCAAATKSWPSTPAPVRPAPGWLGWSGWPGRAG
jgi:hypothetical protein